MDFFARGGVRLEVVEQVDAKGDLIRAGGNFVDALFLGVAEEEFFAIVIDFAGSILRRTDS